MSLDFIRKAELGAIVKQEYSDAQLSKAQKYITNYRGEDLHRDFLQNVPFDITPDNREGYWEMYYATSPLTKDQTVDALAASTTEDIQGMSDPLEKLMHLRDGSYKWSQELVDRFTPEMDRLNNFVSEQSLHMGVLGFQANLRSRLVAKLSDEATYLDGMVPLGVHTADWQDLERNNLGDKIEISPDGRIGARTGNGEWLAAHNLSDSLGEFEEFTPVSKEEQFIVGDKSHKIIREAIEPLLARSREKLMADRTMADNASYDSLKLGLVGKDEAAPIIVNKIAQGNASVQAVVKDSFDAIISNKRNYVPDLGDTLKQGGRLIGEIGRLFNKRDEL